MRRSEKREDGEVREEGRYANGGLSECGLGVLSLRLRLQHSQVCHVHLRLNIK